MSTRENSRPHQLSTCDELTHGGHADFRDGRGFATPLPVHSEHASAWFEQTNWGGGWAFREAKIGKGQPCHVVRIDAEVKLLDHGMCGLCSNIGPLTTLTLSFSVK